MDASRIRTALLAFYDAQRRALPWRTDRDPYRVLVSEIMLQQTQVETVKSYYERWLRRFPDLDALADAPLDDVMKAWEGLGYYRRARHLHAAARAVRERHAGAIPGSELELRALPGVGDYTAGAVASIAFGQAVPAVDGNVRRVIARLFDLDRPSASELRLLASELIDARRPGDFNQALMELGAMVCKPRQPACDRCPLHDHCLSRARGTQRLRPGRGGSRPVPHEEYAVIVVLHGDRRLLQRRAAEGLLGGLWEYPAAVVRGRRDAVREAARLASSLADGRAERLTMLAPLRHAFSHLRVVYHACLFRVVPLTHSARNPTPHPHGLADQPAGWFDDADRAGLALAVAQRKIDALATAAIATLASLPATPRSSASAARRTAHAAARARSGPSRSD